MTRRAFITPLPSWRRPSKCRRSRRWIRPIRDPGYPCYGGPQAAASWLGVWTPGSFGADFPEGTGIRVDPGSKVILQIHYTPQNGAPAPDRCSVDFRRLEPAVAKEAWIQPWFDPSWYGDGVMSIPAGKAEVSYSVAYDPTLFVTQGKPVVMYTAGLHMHALGKSGKISIERADHTTECLLDIPRWQFHWQGAYGFETPKLLGPEIGLPRSATGTTALAINRSSTG